MNCIFIYINKSEKREEKNEELFFYDEPEFSVYVRAIHTKNHLI